MPHFQKLIEPHRIWGMKEQTENHNKLSRSTDMYRTLTPTTNTFSSSVHGVLIG